DHKSDIKDIKEKLYSILAAREVNSPLVEESCSFKSCNSDWRSCVSFSRSATESSAYTRTGEAIRTAAQVKAVHARSKGLSFAFIIPNPFVKLNTDRVYYKLRN